MEPLEIRQQLIRFQKELPKIDSHEHIPAPKYASMAGQDVLDLFFVPYVTDAFLAAGCTKQEYDLLVDHKAPFASRYQVFSRYWVLCEHTAFARAAKLSLQKCYGISDLSEKSMKKANEKLMEERKGDYFTSYRRSMNLEAMLSFLPYNAFEDFREGCYYGIPTVSDLVLNRKSRLLELEEMTEVRIYDLFTLGESLDKLFQRYVASGATAVKFGSAYRRRLDIRPPDDQKAAAELTAVLNLQFIGDDRYLDGGNPAFPWSSCSLWTIG